MEWTHGPAHQHAEVDRFMLGDWGVGVGVGGDPRDGCSRVPAAAQGSLIKQYNLLEYRMSKQAL